MRPAAGQFDRVHSRRHDLANAAIADLRVEFIGNLQIFLTKYPSGIAV
jgi:hypothetical protein